MKVIIKFKNDSKFAQCGATKENFEDVQEIHYNYNGSKAIAFECEGTGYVYDFTDIKEMEVRDQ